MISAVLVSLALVTTPGALSNTWVHWQAWRPILAVTTAQERLVRFEVPIAVYGAAQPDLADVRVVDESGREVPYVVDTPQARITEWWSYATLSDTGFVPGRYTQTVADVGTRGELHNNVKLTIPASEGDFFEWVAIDASDDRHTWRIVRANAPIFRFLSDGLAGQQTVAFPQTSSRWLRVRVLDGHKPFAIEGAMVSHEVVQKVPFQSLHPRAKLNPQSPERRSWWDFDLGVGAVPVSLVTFTATQPAFHRPVTVSASDDGKTWSEVAQGDIYRERGTEKLSVDVPEGRGRYWRVTVYNRSDQPVEGLQLRLLTTPQYVTFNQQPLHSYFLLYGNGRATAPEYDLATLTTREQRNAAPVVAVSEESKNTAYQSPEPWTERHGWLLWVALVAAVVIIGGLALRSMRTGSDANAS